MKFDSICVNRQTLENVNSVKLLGLYITSDLIGMSMCQNYSQKGLNMIIFSKTT